mgnify:CR=1 FL=1
MKLRLQTKIRISSGKVRVKFKNFATSHKEVATPPEKTIRLNAKQQKSSSCDGGYSRKGPRVRANQPFVLYFDTHPCFIGQGTSIVALSVGAQSAN